jgi:hypothetical protein
LDGAFREIQPVIARCCDLVIHAVRFHFRNHIFGDFFVEAVYNRLDAGFGEVIETRLEALVRCLMGTAKMLLES